MFRKRGGARNRAPRAAAGPSYTSGADVAECVALDRNSKDFLEGRVEPGATSHVATPQPRQAGRASGAARREMLAPYIVEVEVNCEECGGSGYDPGGIDPWGPEPCPACRGAKTQKITRNYLGEALRIAANPECQVPVERAHLVAIAQYCRQTVSAVVGLPEVAECAQVQRKRSSRHGRTEGTHPRGVTHIQRRKTNVDISSQWT